MFGTGGKRSLPVTASALSCPDLHLPDQRGDRVEQHVGMFAEHGVDRLRRSLERHVQQIHLGGLLEHFAGEMLGGGKAGARKYDLARIGLGRGDQLFHAVGRKIRARHDQQAGGGNLADRGKGRQRVVAHVLSRDGGDDLAGGHDAERVAVGRGVRDHFIADDAAGAGLVLNHHRLAEFALHRVSQDAADDVGAAARTKGNNETDRLLRPVLRWLPDPQPQ